MSDKTKISIFVVGTEDYLKKSLISLILRRDVFAQRRSDVIIETHVNDTYEVTITPNFNKASEDIRRLFSSQRDPDMCLLVVEDGFTTQQVWQQIDHLHKITRKPTDEFTVVLPLGCEPEESYPFMIYTWDDLFNKLKKMPEKNKKRPAEQQTPMETDKPQSFFGKVGRYLTESLAENKKSSKEIPSDTKVNLVLLGMSGTGKSASGNTILGKRLFKSKASSKPVTTECQAAETVINGTHVRVIDTPDIFNDDIISSVKNHVTQCKQLCQSDPCVYLLVLHVSRFTDGERDILKKFEDAFGSEAKEQTIILFTRGEDLQSSDMSLIDYIHSCEPELKNVIDQCDRRYVLFENKTPDQHQVPALMQTVFRMINKQQKQ